MTAYIIVLHEPKYLWTTGYQAHRCPVRLVYYRSKEYCLRHQTTNIIRTLLGKNNCKTRQEKIKFWDWCVYIKGLTVYISKMKADYRTKMSQTVYNKRFVTNCRETCSTPEVHFNMRLVILFDTKASENMQSKISLTCSDIEEIIGIWRSLVLFGSGNGWTPVRW